MNPAELERRLRACADGEAWVEQVAAYFAGAPLFYGHGTDNATDEAYWLVRAVQGWSHAAWRERPDGRLLGRIVDVARRRVEERRPLAYLLGEAWFAGLRFEVDERVLIPRSPIAELIENGYAPWCRLEAGDRVLDVGTGSGSIAIATAHHCPGARVDATELSVAARAIARANIAALAADAEIALLDADLFASGREKYRLIVANPPYVPSARLGELPPEYAYEPMLALDGGVTGLDVVERIVAGAAAHLSPEGVLIVEVGEAQDAFVAAHPTLPVTWLEFERGGQGVLLTTREELTGHFTS